MKSFVNQYKVRQSNVSLRIDKTLLINAVGITKYESTLLQRATDTAKCDNYSKQ